MWRLRLRCSRALTEPVGRASVPHFPCEGERGNAGSFAREGGVVMSEYWSRLCQLGVRFNPSRRAATETEDLIRRMHVGQRIGVFRFGDLPPDLTMSNTRLYAEQVIPRLRHLWNDDEDHWSPRSPRPLRTANGTGQGRTETNRSERPRTPELAGVN